MVPQTRTMAPGRATLARVAAWCYRPKLKQGKLSKANTGWQSPVYQEGKTAEITKSFGRTTMIRCRRVESRAHLECNVSQMQRAQMSEKRSGDHWSRDPLQKSKMYTGRTMIKT